MRFFFWKRWIEDSNSEKKSILRLEINQMLNKEYLVILNDELVGKTNLEFADPPMGGVSGKIIHDGGKINYESIKSYCRLNKIDLTFDDPKEKSISTRTIEQLKIISPEKVEVKGLGNQIIGMDSEGFEVSLEGIAYPFYKKEFPHHVKEYEERFKE